MTTPAPTTTTANNTTRPLRIGVLGRHRLQGAYTEHLYMLQRLGQTVPLEARIVKTAAELDPAQIDALIIPGGESTAMALVAERSGCLDALREFVHKQPTWGTCAGMILLSTTATQTKQGGQNLLGALDITVQRNAFGKQTESFIAPLAIDGVAPADQPFEGIFIRAPIVEVAGPHVQVIGKVDGDHGLQHGERIVAVRQGHLLGTSFHPELTKDLRVHAYFVQMAREALGL
ncbi:hypothetical protein GGF31_003043 [Allomyces arbusculus]|nr:hypothetical protein GGF31_003043 [Allomyces arbusculus]